MSRQIHRRTSCNIYYFALRSSYSLVYRTHKEFQKKIQDYKRLADLQCQRGLIDKAIECNTQALKFCKDKDPQSKADLEAQKSQLIEMKLKQSIQRIEKGMFFYGI